MVLGVQTTIYRIVKLLRSFFRFYFITVFLFSLPLSLSVSPFRIAIREIVGTDTIGRNGKSVLDVENVLDSSTW